MAFAAITAVPTSPARACQTASQPPLIIEPNPADDVPPSKPEVQVAHVRRGKPPEQHGCTQQSTSCDDIGWVSLSVAATDDVSASERLGYEVEVRGHEDVGGYAEPVMARDGTLRLAWSDGEGEKPVRFAVEIWTVDEAGNRSEQSTTVEVSSPGHDGCTVRGGAARASWLLGLFALLLVRWRTLRSQA